MIPESVRLIGAQMANLCFNLSRRPGEPLSERNAGIMRQLQEQWDKELLREALAQIEQPQRNCDPESWMDTRVGELEILLQGSEERLKAAERKLATARIAFVGITHEETLRQCKRIAFEEIARIDGEALAQIEQPQDNNEPATRDI